MNNLYTYVIDVLGKAEDSPSFTSLKEKTDEWPEALINNDHVREYLFRKSGLHFCFDKTQGHFSSVLFHIGSVMARSGDVVPYIGKLINGVNAADNRGQVERKMGVKPLKTQIIPGNEALQLWETYEIHSLQATFVFDQGTEELISVSIRLQGGL